MSYFLNTAGTLKERLGPLLFQLPPFLKKDVPRLRQFLDLLPSPSRAAFEFRHQSWLETEVFDLLREHNAVLCIAEAENDLEIPFISTAPWGYLRLRRTDYGEAELQAWAQRVRQQDWQEAFIFFKHEDEGMAPALAEAISRFGPWHGSQTLTRVHADGSGSATVSVASSRRLAGWLRIRSITVMNPFESLMPSARRRKRRTTRSRSRSI